MGYEMKLMSKEQEELVLQNTRLVNHLLKKISLNNSLKNVEYEDLYQVGLTGLIKAAKTYNGKVKFATYAAKCINNEIYMFFRKSNKWQKEVSLDDTISTDEDGMELTLGDIIPAEGSNFVDQIVDWEIIEKAYNVILNSFSQMNTLVLLYDFCGMRQRDIAEKFCMSQSYVSRLLVKLKKKLSKIVDKNIKLKEVFKVNIRSDGFRITFTTRDISKFNKLILNIFMVNSAISDYKIIRNNDKITFATSDVQNIASIITLLVENISNYSISVVNSKSEEITNDNPENSDSVNYIDKINTDVEKSTQTPTYAHVSTDATKGSVVANNIRSYYMCFTEFNVNQLKAKFPNYDSATVSNTLFADKKKGIIESIGRGKYRVIKSC